MQARRGLSLQNSWIDESRGEKDKIHENTWDVLMNKFWVIEELLTKIQSTLL